VEWEDRLFAWASEQVRREVQDTTWQAFWKTAIEGQSGKQVATALGLSVTAVYNARSRVRARLREIIHNVQQDEP
jgi:RNA polymerase sigma-70 factor (ECF subfamily)